ncbi:MAG: glutamine-hydrolyzing carbamoyl-phosphate synthase small subunit [Dehalococcoidia bacterium]|jgi:carbamoyl-phosphate synthase small subunit
MIKKAILVLNDGTVYEGYSFGAEVDTCGEVVFNTSMAGYQEMLTDPSYAGQILLPTYPLIGNYGTNQQDMESRQIQVRGFIVREKCDQPSHYLDDKTVHDYLAESGVAGIWGIDTRAITRRLRSVGVMMGIITSSKTPGEALEELKKQPDYGSIDFARQVSTDKQYKWEENGTDGHHVVVFDCGLKYNILRLLCRHGCHVTVVPCTTTAEEILALEPDGILLSPGPGDPDLLELEYLAKTVRGLVGKKPLMGICLGNQLIHKAFGGKHFKLKFGHRGGNHPVRELATGAVHITAQNHGYAADPDTLSDELEITHINLNDGTVEGLRHRELPIFSIQYHSEASPGPLDNVYLFKKFIDNIQKFKEGE